MNNYDRRFEFLIDGVPFINGGKGRQFSVSFDITHDFGGFNSYGDFTIRNLSETTAGKVLKKGSRITFRAGYVDNIGVIFDGTIKNAIRNRPEIGSTGTRLICVGGNLSTDRPLITKAFGAGVKVTALIQALADALGLSLSFTAADFADVSPYAGGYSLNGDPMTYLKKLADVHRFAFIVQGNILVVVREGSSVPGPVTVISQFTGMEDIPEITETGADVVVRLNPKAQIGGKFRIESRLSRFAFSNLYFQDVPESAGKGEYRIMRIQHSGDSTGDRWSTKLTGLR